MARDRQRAKQRQAERRAARLAQRRDARRDGDGDATAAKRREASPLDEPTPAEQDEIQAGAPPEDLGRSDRVVESQQSPDEEALDLDVDEDFADDEEDLDEEEFAAEDDAVNERDKTPAAAHRKDRGKVLSFLVACWAELKHVQWPTRKALTQLTGIVLFFVLIAGGYLGLLDAIFSRVIKAIL